jgi:putative endonuclease
MSHGRLDLFSPGSDTRARGRVGETVAERWLRRQGFKILDRNVVTKIGEIDLIAQEEETLCFIEVKARTSRQYGPAIAAVHLGKQRRLARAAALYLARKPWEGPCRFDVLGMERADEGWQFLLIRAAFEAA